jgi:hypothetical protein
METFGKSIFHFFFWVGLLCTFYAGKYVFAVQTELPPPPRRNTTRVIPMAVTNLSPGMVIRSDDIGAGPWGASEIVGDVLLADKYIVGRVVKDEIKAATPIHSTSIHRLGEYPKEYVGVP